MTRTAEHYAFPNRIYVIRIVRSDYAVAEYYNGAAPLVIGLWRKHGHWVTGEPERVIRVGRNIVSHYAGGLTRRCS